MVSQRNTVFKESLLSLTVTENFSFNKRLGELYELNDRNEEAADYLERALIIYEENPSLEVELSAELDLLTSLVFCLNAQGSFEKALVYNKRLHELNKSLSPKHPNTLNSCLSMIKLLAKQKHSRVAKDRGINKKEILVELIHQLIANCKTFAREYAKSGAQNLDSHEFELFKSYILPKSTLETLQSEFDTHLDEGETFFFVKTLSLKEIGRLLKLAREIKHKIDPRLLKRKEERLK